MSTNFTIPHPLLNRSIRRLFLSLLCIYAFFTCPAYSQSIENEADIIEGIFTNPNVTSGNDLVLLAQAGTSWSWTGPNGFTSSLAFNLIHNVDTSYTGTYYLTAVDTIRDTTFYFSVNVTIEEPQFNGIQLDKEYVCEYNDFTATIDPVHTGTGYTYLWSTTLPNPGGIPAGQVANPTLIINTGNVNGNYIFYVVYADVYLNGNFVCTLNDTLDVLDCCVNQNIIYIEDQSLSSGINLTTGPTIVIKGTFTVDQNLTLPQNVKKIILLEGSGIIVDHGKILTISNEEETVLTGCHKMWEAVFLLGNSTFIANNCSFYNAQKAIRIHSPGILVTMDIRYCNFIDNHRGIHIEETALKWDLWHNTFSATPNQYLLPPNTTNNTKEPYAGINAQSCPLIMPDGEGNVFSNTIFGISGPASNLYIDADLAQFYDIKPSVIYLPSGDTFGGAAMANTLNNPSTVYFVQKNG